MTRNNSYSNSSEIHTSFDPLLIWSTTETNYTLPSAPKLANYLKIHLLKLSQEQQDIIEDSPQRLLSSLFCKEESKEKTQRMHEGRTKGKDSSSTNFKSHHLVNTVVCPSFFKEWAETLEFTWKTVGGTRKLGENILRNVWLKDF